MQANIITSVTVKNFFEDASSLIGNSALDASSFTGNYFHLRVAGQLDDQSGDINPVALFASASDGQPLACLPLSKSDQRDPYDFIQNFLADTFGLTSNDDNDEMMVDTICDGLLSLDFEPYAFGKMFVSNVDLLQLPKALSSRDWEKLSYLIHRTVDVSGISVDFTEKMTGSEVLELLIDNATDDTFMQKLEVMALAFKAS